MASGDANECLAILVVGSLSSLSLESVLLPIRGKTVFQRDLHIGFANKTHHQQDQRTDDRRDGGRSCSTCNTPAKTRHQDGRAKYCHFSRREDHQIVSDYVGQIDHDIDLHRSLTVTISTVNRCPKVIVRLV